MLRKEKLVTGEIYHVMNKSIAGYKIFNSDGDYARMKRMIAYYPFEGKLKKFCKYLEQLKQREESFEDHFSTLMSQKSLQIQVIAYCLMPTHFHLVLKQLADKGIEKYLAKLLNSYAHYFNIRHNRKGHLWAGRFKNVLVETDEQLIHLTRYVHLNPVSSGLALKAEDWPYSSFGEYVSNERPSYKVCHQINIADMTPVEYEQFVNDHAVNQRSLAIVKKISLE